MSLCRCGKVRRHHEVTDACLSPEDQALVRQFAAEYDRAQREKEDGPWWSQAAGRDAQANAEAPKPAKASEDAPTPCPTCGTPTWNGLHRNGHRDCLMSEVPGA